LKEGSVRFKTPIVNKFKMAAATILNLVWVHNFGVELIIFFAFGMVTDDEQPKVTHE